MVVALRLQRLGCRHRPFYRVVIADSRSPRDGKFIENVGTYNPIPRKNGDNASKICTLNFDRIKYWMSVGAQPSERVAYLLAKAGIIPAPPLRKQGGHVPTKHQQKNAEKK
eukprot:m.11238 g.11238  ORF g.11238 m.11238 type:complete len:111 (-) comp6840_c0_seq1:146-478(-)